MRKLAAATALLAPAAASVGTLYATYRYAFHSPNSRQNDDHAVAHTSQMDPLSDRIHGMIDAAQAIPYESVWITCRDGLQLHARYYHSRDGAPLNICFHGYRGTPRRDFSGGIQIMLKAGQNVLMVEQRAHCESEGSTITFGVKERYDCLDWIHYALDRFGRGTKILLVGISMGASTVLMAAGLPLPPEIKGIIADCPYTSPEAIIRKVVGGKRRPTELSYRVTALAARLFGGFDLTAASPLEAVTKTKLPILLIHGEEDRFVPCTMSKELYAAAPDHIQLELFPGAGHGLSYLVDQERYERVVREFQQQVLGE